MDIIRTSISPQLFPCPSSLAPVDPWPLKAGAVVACTRRAPGATKLVTAAPAVAAMAIFDMAGMARDFRRREPTSASTWGTGLKPQAHGRKLQLRQGSIHQFMGLRSTNKRRRDTTATLHKSTIGSQWLHCLGNQRYFFSNSSWCCPGRLSISNGWFTGEATSLKFTLHCHYPWFIWSWKVILLMEDIQHQLIGSLSHFL